MTDTYDFSGWATKNNIKCSDGRTIMKDAFKHNDGSKVPLIWNHEHSNPFNVLGHALLENRDEGVYAYCYFNDTESGETAKKTVLHGDVTSLSIYANHLTQKSGNVVHGNIREVSLVLAGANPGALIESVLRHDDGSDEEAIIYTGEIVSIAHNDKDDPEDEEEMATNNKNEVVEETPEEPEGENTSEEDEKLEHSEGESNDETVGDVFNTLTDKQKKAVYAIVASLVGDDDDEEETPDMKHNVFDTEETNDDVISHSDMMAVINDAKRYGSMSESALQHGITNIEYLFPDARTVNNTPDFIKREDTWVSIVMNGTHHTPFSRIKSIHANITEDEARAKGYIKGKLKKEEVFSLLKRITTPQTIYKKQKLDRDDVIDITDFDVVAWLKTEMRMMLDEEIARAILVGDGRIAGDDKINETNIRPVWTDADLYTVKAVITKAPTDTEDDLAKKFIRTAIKARKSYKGSGNPILFTTEDMLTDMLLITDNEGRDLYTSVDQLATKLRVSRIVTVPIMEGLHREVEAKQHDLLGLILNLNDYNVGADKGGEVNMFDDFDIDYNAQKYLIETRCSGALTVPYSAIAIEAVAQDQK